jgi:hypothetical protein
MPPRDPERNRLAAMKSALNPASIRKERSAVALRHNASEMGTSISINPA